MLRTSLSALAWLRMTAAAALLLVTASPASALAVYEYTGEFFTNVIDNTPPAGTYTTSMRVTGTLTLTAPVAPDTELADFVPDLVSISFTDGRNVLTEADAAFLTVLLGTDGEGNIDEWSVQLATAAPVAIGEQQLTLQSLNAVIAPLPLLQADQGQVRECVSLPCGIQNDIGSVGSSPGSWTLTIVPEPSTTLLLGVCLAAFGVLRARPVSSGDEG